jgi:hypothetical protein
MPNTGTMVEDESRPCKDLTLYEYICTADGGAFAYTTIGSVLGYLYMVLVIPDVTTPPSDGFTMTILDDNGIDVMGGAFSGGISSTIPSQWVPSIGPVYGIRRCNGVLRFVIAANVVSGGIFELQLFVKPPENLFQ